MNLSVYFFGDLGSGYTQYPDDYTNTIFDTFYKNAQATTQIAIHREGDLMYYGYIRKLEERNYIGLCAIVNGKMISQVGSLFSIFESVIESMVRNGYLIHFNDKGDITAKLNQLYENEEEIDLITSSIQSSFNSLESVSEKLPPVNYSTSKDSVKNFSIQDDEAEIIKSSYTNGYTFIYKSEGFNTTQMNSYKAVLARKEDENSKLREELSKLKSDATSLRTTNPTSITKSGNYGLWIIGLGILVIIVIMCMRSNDRKNLAVEKSIVKIDTIYTTINNTEDNVAYDNVYVEENDDNDDDPYELDVWIGRYKITGGVYRTCDTQAYLSLEKVEKDFYTGNLLLMLGYEDLDERFCPDYGTMNANVSAKVTNNQMVVLLEDFVIEEGENGSYISDYLKKGQPIFCINIENGIYSAKTLGNMDFCFDSGGDGDGYISSINKL